MMPSIHVKAHVAALTDQRTFYVYGRYSGDGNIECHIPHRQTGKLTKMVINPDDLHSEDYRRFKNSETNKWTQYRLLSIQYIKKPGKNNT